MSYSLGKPKERIIRKILVLESQKFRPIKHIVFNNPPFKEQIIMMILINKAQKDCGLPIIMF